eukprot:scaffold903_cov262-Pinguiococcus_pyrenoidosus.AAC.14
MTIIILISTYETPCPSPDNSFPAQSLLCVFSRPSSSVVQSSPLSQRTSAPAQLSKGPARARRCATLAAPCAAGASTRTASASSPSALPRSECGQKRVAHWSAAHLSRMALPPHSSLSLCCCSSALRLRSW